jgi:hypothetical protein
MTDDKSKYRETRTHVLGQMEDLMAKAKYEKRELDATEAGEYDRLKQDILHLDRLIGVPDTGIATRGVGGRTHAVSREVTRRAAAYMPLIGTDTYDLPSPDKPIEARHDVNAWMSQRADYNPTNIDLGSFDRDAMWRQIITRNQAGREYRALAEGAQSASASGGGVTVPISFSGNILPLMRAALVFTAEGADGGAVNGPTIMPMKTQVEYYPTFNSDGSGVTTYVAENTSLTPGTATLGRGVLNAWRHVSSLTTPTSTGALLT